MKIETALLRLPEQVLADLGWQVFLRLPAAVRPPAGGSLRPAECERRSEKGPNDRRRPGRSGACSTALPRASIRTTRGTSCRPAR